MTTFDTLRVKVGRRPITVVELDLDFCQNVYGTSPCTAAIGTTGSQKCFNCFASCQDTPNYNKGVKTYSFCSDTALLPIGTNIFPCVTDVDIAPTQLDPKGFSVSASVTVTMRDFPHHDRGIDPYYATRSYSPQGTFFGKLRARNPYLVNRVMRVKEGYVDENRTIYTRSRTYFIDHIEGPDANGTVKVIGKDILRFADTEKSTAPVLSTGSLSADITAVATSFTLKPAGSGAKYTSSGTIRIGDELMTYTGLTGDTLTGVTRATDGTAADTHSAGDVVQQCLRYTAQTVPYIINDLLTNYAGISSAYIPYADWLTEAGLWISTYTSSVVISAPTGVKDLIEEIELSFGVALWWDEVNAQIRFKVLVPAIVNGTIPSLDETGNILKGTLSIQDNEKDRVSRVYLYYGLNSVIANVDKENFSNVSVVVDGTGESVNAYNVPNTFEILSRWVGSQAVADEVCSRFIGRYKVTPRELTFQLDAKDATLNTGDLVDVHSRLIQDATGAMALSRCIVLEASPKDVGTTYEYVALQISQNAATAALIAPDAEPDWTSAAAADKGKYMFISNDAGLMSDFTQGPHIV
ncbi:hypothetical protein ACVIHC_002190 [Bradyrhizobium diazoefficiens]